MPNEERGNQLEEMSELECLQKLEHYQLGRIGFVVDGQPLILPVNYAIRDRIVTFRTAPGTKLTHAPGSKVAFEIDGYDAASGVGWSVLVQGVAIDATIAQDDASWTARNASPRPAAPGLRVHRLAVDPTAITGRRFALPARVGAEW